MILIADSGSTKTDWCLVEDNGERKYFQTLGMNPYIIESKKIEEEVETKLMPFFNLKEVKDLFFYGSGCSTIEKVKFMQDAFQKYFTTANIHIEHDLMGAARALCGNSPGIVGILGTGSNSCLYDGMNVVENVPSLGYIFSDEGAGSQIGKLLLKDYLQHKFPPYLHDDFEKKYPGTESQLLDKIYKGDFPNRFLASLATFAMEHKNESYIRTLLDNAFGAFFGEQIMQYTNYQDYKIQLVGSIAFYLQDIISQRAKDFGLEIGTVLKAPLEALVDYHVKN